MANAPTSPRPAPTKDATSPAAVFRYGSISAAVYRKQQQTKDGKSFPVSQVSLRRSYRKADGTWEHTHTLRESDLLDAAHALTKCSDYLAEAQTASDAA